MKNRTLPAAIILVLALLMLAVALHGTGFRRQAQHPAPESLSPARSAVQPAPTPSPAPAPASPPTSARPVDEEELSARRLALSYRLRKVAGKRAQAEAIGAGAESLSALDQQVKKLEDELRSLK